MSDPSNQQKRKRRLLERLAVYQRADKLFWAFMAKPMIARQFYRAFLPPNIVDLMEDTDPVLVSGRDVDEALRERRPDVVHEIPVRSKKSPRIYGLLEHKSQNDRNTPAQVVGYILGVWRLDRDRYRSATGPWRRPLVYCFVFYHGKGKWTTPRSLQDLMNLDNDRALSLPVPADPKYDLHRSIDVWRHDIDATRHFPELTVMLLVLKCPPLDELLPYLHLVPDLGELRLQVNFFLLHHYEGIDMKDAERIRSALRLDKEELEEEMENSLAHCLRAEGRVEGIAKGHAEGIAKGRAEGITKGRAEGITKGRAEGITKGRAEGITKGRAEGITEGEARGRAAILVRLLEHQFGDISETARNRVATASLEQLEQWGIGLLSASTLDELFGKVKTS